MLRILRGAGDAPMTCSQIGDRLLDRTPDVTRLLARLERAGLVSRSRAERDRRAVEVALTDAGRTSWPPSTPGPRATDRDRHAHLSAANSRRSRAARGLRTDQV